MVPDPFQFTTIAHANRDVLGPYSTATALKNLGGFGGFVVDVGCGKGAVLEALDAPGIGLEHCPAFAEIARSRNLKADIWEEDASIGLGRLPQTPELIVCLGASQAVGTPVEALTRFSEILAPGGHLLFGDGYWRQSPSSEYLDFLDCRESDMETFGSCPVVARSFGLETLTSYEATHQEWADYEDSYYESMMSWCDSHPDDGDAPGFRDRITSWRDMYLRWGRDTLGFGIYLFRKS